MLHIANVEMTRPVESNVVLKINLTCFFLSVLTRVLGNLRCGLNYISLLDVAGLEAFKLRDSNTGERSSKQNGEVSLPHNHLQPQPQREREQEPSHTAGQEAGQQPSRRKDQSRTDTSEQEPLRQRETSGGGGWGSNETAGDFPEFCVGKFLLRDKHF